MQRPHRLAVLLPNDGPLARVAAAVRDGLLAARFADAGPARAEVLFFDSTAGELPELMEQIRNAQADLIIGPLAKDQVDALAARADLPAPVLALNTTGKPVSDPAQFKQFALSPEDEAADAANRAWQDGARRIATLVANTSVGGRQLQAFTARWAALGGEVVGSARFNRSANAYAESTAQLFGLGESKARAASLRQALGREIGFEPSPRSDIDAVFVAGATQDAHQLMPQFRYVRADGVQVYGAPAILDGLHDSRADQDLEGLRAGGTAWSAGQAVARGLREAFDSAWGESNELQRFFAFGVDAWLIGSQLGKLHADPAARVEGVTGQLSLDESGVVRRALYWAEIHEGAAKPLEMGPVAR